MPQNPHGRAPERSGLLGFLHRRLDLPRVYRKRNLHQRRRHVFCRHTITGKHRQPRFPSAFTRRQLHRRGQRSIRFLHSSQPTRTARRFGINSLGTETPALSKADTQQLRYRFHSPKARHPNRKRRQSRRHQPSPRRPRSRRHQPSQRSRRRPAPARLRVAPTSTALPESPAPPRTLTSGRSGSAASSRTPRPRFERTKPTTATGLTCSIPMAVASRLSRSLRPTASSGSPSKESEAGTPSPSSTLRRVP